MLKKKVCKKCWYEIEIIHGDGWRVCDEQDWKKGKVYCPLNYIKDNENIFRNITEQPPERCPYYLENLL